MKLNITLEGLESFDDGEASTFLTPNDTVELNTRTYRGVYYSKSMPRGIYNRPSADTIGNPDTSPEGLKDIKATNEAIAQWEIEVDDKFKKQLDKMNESAIAFREAVDSGRAVMPSSPAEAAQRETQHYEDSCFLFGGLIVIFTIISFAAAYCGVWATAIPTIVLVFGGIICWFWCKFRLTELNN